ncbi:uncharacterized protein LOC135685036 [Rhopilema esculentum]|uniref:uncharacterized protein LOC135685036 n=1 Tax=Rhopilema esculentum TaxID=499914 RepID=UPI0031DDCA74|eukprot:gene17088-8605_t
MAAITISALTAFFSDEPKSIQRGENHFRSDHVESFYYSDGVIRGSVHASMKNKSYKVTVFLRNDEIISSECECPRGSYKCAHAAAIIIHGIHNLSRTDVECEWKKQKAPLDVKSVEELYPCPKEYNCLKREVNDDDRSWFYQELKKYGSFTGTLWLLSPEPAKALLPITPVEDIIVSSEFINHNNQREYLVKRLEITAEQRLKVNQVTIKQRENPSWHILRKGRLTASNFGSVLKAKKATPSFIKRVLGQYDLSGVKAIHWGIVNENEARKVFEQKTNLKVEDSGLWLELSGILGASPDGLIDENALLEIKCPYSQRDCTIEEAIRSENFYIKKYDDGVYQLKQTHDYWHQIQGQLHLTDREVCFFVVWTTKQSFIIQIKKDPAWAENLLILKDFYIKNMIPAFAKDLL